MPKVPGLDVVLTRRRQGTDAPPTGTTSERKTGLKRPDVATPASVATTVAGFESRNSTWARVSRGGSRSGLVLP